MRYNPRIEQRQIEQLHDQCFSWALTCVRGRRDEAEDVLQMTYLAIVEGKAQFRGQSSLRTWLFAVIRNVAASRWRRTQRSLLAVARIASFAPVAEAAAEAVQPEAASRVVRALESLPQRQREVLDLVFYRGLPIAEAARILGISVGTARVHYERGKAALRPLLADLRPAP